MAAFHLLLIEEIHMDIVVFGASGPTGLLICRQAIAAGHSVRAVSRRTDPLPLPSSTELEQVLADPGTGHGVTEALSGAQAALSALGGTYTRKSIDIYSAGARHIVADHIIFPLLRNVIGKTLYTDMRAMEEYLLTCTDIDWTVMRPGRLINREGVSDYRVGMCSLEGSFTSRADLAAAMIAELEETPHIRQVIAPSTDRKVK